MVILWDVATWEPKLFLSTESARVQALAFTSDDGALLAGRYDDGGVHVWRGGIPADDPRRLSSQSSSEQTKAVLP
jgi:hypothetical protein